MRTQLVEHCDVPDKAQLEDKLDKLIRNLPKEHVILPRATFLEEGTLYGLDRLKGEQKGRRTGPEAGRTGQCGDQEADISSDGTTWRQRDIDGQRG
ncbi:hypothetical protein HPB47_016698 [Ixodes persulcatus]|uniref:Uncharacterized protein n=1 Tax=Ixodes persulcatus TaxID=34615 RepID=A0AC60QSP1_IXOPE|nr:hypothetical protein HPB47_016698 [Ixodes persulcatus]